MKTLTIILSLILTSYSFGEDIPLLKINTHRKIIFKNKEIKASLTLPGGSPLPIVIRRRGKSSDKFPKKQYQFKFLDSEGKSVKKSIFSFTKGKKWILNGPYADRTLMRNTLAFKMARSLKNSNDKFWYAPRTKYVELTINKRYKGIYVLIEKIARGKTRVPIKKFSSTNEEFIAEIHGETYGAKADFNSEKKTALQFFQPSRKDVKKFAKEGFPAKKIIKDIIDHFEHKLDNAKTLSDLEDIIDVRSFANYILIQEIFKNLDGYRRSAYFHYKNGKIHMGPIWDFNISMGNFTFYKNIMKTTGLMYPKEHYFDGNQNAFWFKKLMTFKGFQKIVREIYKKERLSGGAFSWDTLSENISLFRKDLGAGAIYRNFDRWKILGRIMYPIWYNRGTLPKTYHGEIHKMKSWLSRRLQWLDIHFNVNIDPLNNFGT